MTSPRYLEIEAAWDRFLRGEPREAVASLVALVRARPTGLLATDQRLLAIQTLGDIGATTREIGHRRMSLWPEETEIAPLRELAVPLLAEALVGPDDRVRHRAVAALRQIGPPAAAAVPALRRLCDGSDGLLRMFATRALAAIQPPPAGHA